MNKLVLGLSFLVATELNAASENNPKSLYARCRPGVVLITTANALGFSVALGTGFAVSDGTKLVTNLHVIRGATTVKIKTADDHEYEVKNLLGQDDAQDVAILESPVHLPQLLLSESTPSVGDVIFTIGIRVGSKAVFQKDSSAVCVNCTGQVCIRLALRSRREAVADLC